jgi:hypothetical protein
MYRYSQAAAVPRETSWCKSSRSNPSQNCVEVRVDGPVARFRDSKNTVGPVLACAAGSLLALVDAIRRGELDN